MNYLLDLYKLTKDELIKKLNDGRKEDLLTLETFNDILKQKEQVNATFLNKLDKLFDKGITWYISKRALPERKSSSIFFRKDTFNTELNFGSKKLVNSYEELKFEIQNMNSNIHFQSKKIVKHYSIKDAPKKVAEEILDVFNDVQKTLIEKKQIIKSKDDKNQLTNLIRIIEELNVFVFEFTENWNKKEKANFNGFFLAPNIIVIKRQKYFRRELFTLIHEFAHYLLNAEEIDEISDDAVTNENDIENWCNNFTYYFLLNGHSADIDKIKVANKANDFCIREVAFLYEKTYLSKLSIYTRLLIENKISQKDYDKIIVDIKNNVRQKEIEDKLQMQEQARLLKEQGKEVYVLAPKPVESKLFKEIVKINFFEGHINETQLRKFLKIKPGKDITEVVY
jgi:Zn-dependent peptidase ImmA (M78 family)